jgi:hypothetical protein
MSNHLHGIIIIVGVAQTKQPTLGDIIGAFKSITTNEYIKGMGNKNWPRFNKRL